MGILALLGKLNFELRRQLTLGVLVCTFFL